MVKQAAVVKGLFLTSYIEFLGGFVGFFTVYLSFSAEK